MRDYGKIYTSLWRSRKFTSLESDDAKLLYLYLHTCAHANMVGCFILPDGYATADLEWDTTRYRHALDTLSTACLVGVDRGEKLVRIVDFLRHDPFTNASHATGALKVALALPDCDERSFLFHARIEMGRSRCNSDTVSIPYRQEQEQEPEPEPEPEPDKKITAAHSARKTDLPKPETDRESILDAIGVDRVSGLTGKGGSMLGNRTDMAEVERWLDLPGITVPVVLEEVRRMMARKRDGPPSNFKFFTSAMQRLSGELSRPPLNPNQPIERAAQ